MGLFITSHGKRLVAIAGALTLAISLGIAPLTATAAPQSPTETQSANGQTISSGDNWTVTKVAGGYQVSVTITGDLPMRDAAPHIYADGTDLGAAHETLDGSAVTLITDNPTAAAAKTFAIGFDDTGITPRSKAKARKSAPNATPDAEPDGIAKTVVDTDLDKPGQYQVAEQTYDLGDQAIDLKDIGGIKGEFRGIAYYPSNKTTPSPLVVLLHGRHTSCATVKEGVQNPNRYPCVDGQVDVPSYLGYEYTAKLLASRGYAVVSISANAINANDNQLASDYGAAARGWLVLDHLDYLKRANAGSVDGLGTALTGRLDLSNIGLMGHSRGGEGVVRAAQLNQTLDQPYAIRSVFALAPVDFSRLTLPGVSLMTTLPYCDGDVSNLQGQHFIDDTSASFQDGVLRSTVLVRGANHNFFNTVWTPGQYDHAASDDWGYADEDQTNPVCGVNSPTSERLTDEQERAVGNGILQSWFLFTMGGDQQYLPFFDGSNVTNSVYGTAKVSSTVQTPSDAQASINPFTSPTTTTSTSDTATAMICSDAKSCGADLPSSRIPHWAAMRFAKSSPGTAVMKFDWTAKDTSLTVDVPSASRDASGYQSLNFRAAPGAFENAATDLSIMLTDAAGASASVSTADYSDALSPLPGDGGDYIGKTILRQASIPLSAFTGVDLTNVTAVRFSSLTDTGTAYLSDLAFANPSAGSSTPAPSLPQVSVGSTYVNEGNGSRSVKVGITLDRKSTKPVTGRFEVISKVKDGPNAAPAATGFTFQPGQDCVVVDVPVTGDTAKSTQPTTSFTSTIAVVSGAITKNTFAPFTIREDDGVVDTNGKDAESAPDPGADPDPCAGRNLADSRTMVSGPSTVEEGSDTSVKVEVIGISQSAKPTGAVTLTENGQTLASGTLGEDGTVSITLPTDLTAGEHKLTVTYNGDTAFATSSALYTVTVTKKTDTGGDGQGGTGGTGNGTGGTTASGKPTTPDNGGTGNGTNRKAGSSATGRLSKTGVAVTGLLAAALIMGAIGTALLKRRGRHRQ
ncbi:Ig-like domain repeat protein [Bifidobacterium sp. CP2]|uniref:Ig-like domain repeat protein n=1 Tax=Bifidobacterium sp. CP2 TaxID=2809025 RepID=UPI001BDBE77A|nr:Ig-like domain repeat protein [Bifidobacterium sp. CP2]MBT1182014.1 Ig-like domain repeat protein [Bifidobacterium sp. CP2]